MTNNKTKEQDWENEFDDRFILVDSLGKEHCNLKYFIRKQITLTHNSAIDEAVGVVENVRDLTLTFEEGEGFLKHKEQSIKSLTNLKTSITCESEEKE